MAKTKVTEAEEPIEVSAKLEKIIDGIKQPFVRFVKGFAELEQKRTDLAPKFMKAANTFMAETGGSFVDFVRYIVPGVGPSVAEYKIHPAYNAAQYLKRKAEQIARAEREPETPQQRAERVATSPATANTALARVVATLLELIPADQVDQFKAAMRSELHWAERKVERVMADAEERVDPLVAIKVPKGTEIPALKLSVPVAEQKIAA